MLSHAAHVEGIEQLLVGRTAHARGTASLVLAFAILVERALALVFGRTRLVDGA
jgi:hypothetical protein